MNNKQVIKRMGVALLALGFAFCGVGCDFIVADSVKDLNQTVATVNITEVMKKDAANTAVAEEVSTLIKNNGLSTNIPKRDLVSSFMSMGQTYIQNYGMTYAQTFTALMDGLANRKIMAQYAVAHYIEKRPESAKSFEDFKAEELAQADDDEKKLIEKYPEVLTMKYYLTDYGKTDADSMKPYLEAVYSLKKSLNSSLDNAEETYIKNTSSDHTHEETRTTPTAVNTETEDYLPTTAEGELDYDIYTGRNTLDSCGKYERVKGSSSSSRMSAYNSLLSNLQGYGLIKKNENTSVITKLEYYYQELSSALSQALINKYYDELEEEAIADLQADNYAYVTTKYNEILAGQQNAYTDTDGASSFKTALDGLSDTSFLLYGLQDYGFVYNILLPFSDTQSQKYEALKKKGLSDDELYNARKEILANIEAIDLRTAWFCTDEAEHYAYEVTQDYYGAVANEKAYLFFEDNMTNTDKYEKIDHYYGQYPYQGTVTLNEDEDKYEFEKKKFKIDDFIAEMEGYINYAVGGNVANGTRDVRYNDTVYTEIKNDEKIVDYSKFVYYQGQVTLTDQSADNYFNPNTDAYKALSAVNELMFAFSTDTGCLNKYMGYVVAADKTDFVSEFEYASQLVVKEGVGAYAVAPSDYGWHIIYCAYKYDGGAVYSGFDATKVEEEGTFSKMFYESLKAKATTAKATDVQTEVLRQYKDATKLYEKTYKDLMELDN